VKIGDIIHVATDGDNVLLKSPHGFIYGKTAAECFEECAAWGMDYGVAVCVQLAPYNPTATREEGAKA
jgi:hypothetical protein